MSNSMFLLQCQKETVFELAKTLRSFVIGSPLNFITPDVHFVGVRQSKTHPLVEILPPKVAQTLWFRKNP